MSKATQATGLDWHRACTDNTRVSTKAQVEALEPSAQIQFERWTMSIAGVSPGGLVSQYLLGWQTSAQKFQGQFQKLGTDLQTGNLSQAQADFTSLSQNIPGSSQNNGLLSQAFSSLSSALQSGNLSAAQQAYATVQQDFKAAGQGHHHHHLGTDSQSATSSTGSAVSQLFSSLGADLQAGNLSAAQTAYATLQQDLQQLGWVTATQSASGTLSITG
jgi:hypothetical protein